ncbi:beta-1,3-galactosyl-O-glycosyl-glycoprotein beta-1,6-N-acetylglucosaminyltransferase-like [Scyliorhinus canicula]|uniref:beta-1,3-galactosyl-O-glycosyl-glycoprotein beta-1,6-N-acetylglucosaminyltransferase-like n=1 Tax=Scyliorhinus canicula TaxID=7830 RepID=UPI0018F38E87|nr:beta-1,3-galactosyl-O-glycosyl-glycoprotein beta-1,6-N-acetylglucosaminyltransferase-like [Scyliorhinus canicula]XP_038634116.1 beta-1,3-galactosyl-O-glycosyl-glycoprotein beta-1,6-N-acetylglucosaminyltransferase-like [Scyliorhinus canicula]XP_038634117.1 beta-1,3-galactosyl-O-glycosyl-glycoprotein beta-1,6-N-acetylglucosaminyltransferase-like [Scyliorhinus canicula]XP_038634118.1 beta-1,3-galactosyl-O-glycosyl-glycoprotein beta-1,6-N-acetylglucosaminyltransferase-like [Scyliorhinus canicula]
MILKYKRFVQWYSVILVLTCITLLVLNLSARKGFLTNEQDLSVKIQHFMGNQNLPTSGVHNVRCSELELLLESFYDVNCTAILQGEVNEIKRSQLLKVQHKAVTPNYSYYIEATQNCVNLIRSRKYITFTLNRREEQIPIAYSIVIHQKVDQFERLLRTIYAPQNIYCVHIDNKSSIAFKTAVRSIASCFPNIFIPAKLENVTYGSWSRVQADLNCMEELLARHLTWKYFINLCGMDFPIKTNLEIVHQLEHLAGGNSLESEAVVGPKVMRWKYSFKVINGQMTHMQVTKKPIFNTSSMFSGNAYIVVSRQFIEHIFKDPKAKQFIEWSQDTYSPDEFLWATLQRMPGVPGSKPSHRKYDVSDMNSIARLVKWQHLEGDVNKEKAYPLCTGSHLRCVCVYGAGDLNWILQQHHLFANKFDAEVDPIALQCLEQHIRQKTLLGCST